MNHEKVWFVTGASKGLGLILCKQLLAAGAMVAATSRDKIALETAVDVKSEHFLPLVADLGSEDSVRQAVQKTLEQFGRIDVVVNNAGFGQIGTLEELTDSEVKKSFEINVFGMLNVIRNVMPHLRSQKHGHIINISSMAGIQGYIPGWGVYCAAKFAVAGMTEALAAEVGDFNINVTLVYPGHMRTNFLSSDSIMSAKNPLSEYQSIRENEKMAKEQMNGHQIGDPEKAAALLIKISNETNPPLHYFIGEDVYKAALSKIKTITESLEARKTDTLSISF
ncbi:SDR family oxidoreductase [Pseudomonas putida]|uniref:SDR family oxidoreductase n=1 Tax=Pseudomonas putida TaxID=303 RepID=UPI00117A3FB5|nr:SDR family oxidoreductase [Pseudomonas putida]TRO38274.1 SDR family oxidoreductase [Pseudomonas putida]